MTGRRCGNVLTCFKLCAEVATSEALGVLQGMERHGRSGRAMQGGRKLSMTADAGSQDDGEKEQGMLNIKVDLYWLMDHTFLWTSNRGT